MSKKNPLGLKEDELDFYRALLKDNNFSLYEILDINLGQGMKVRNIFTGKKYDLLEHMGTFGAKVGAVTFCRVAKVYDHYEIVGADTFMLETKSKKDIDSVIKNFKSLRIPMSPIFANVFWLVNNTPR